PGSPSVRKITYSPERIKRGYSFFASAEPLEQIAEQHRQLLAAKPEDIRRPEKLMSLKPFVHQSPPALSRDELAPKVRSAISSLDERGAWLEPYVPGKSTAPPVQRRMSSGAFARNMKLLSNYLVASE
ncbi:MAG: hypothetical protein ACYS21_14555, partial [Planctomycetota bacterium]